MSPRVTALTCRVACAGVIATFAVRQFMGARDEKREMDKRKGNQSVARHRRPATVIAGDRISREARETRVGSREGGRDKQRERGRD